MPCITALGFRGIALSGIEIPRIAPIVSTKRLRAPGPVLLVDLLDGAGAH